MRSFLLSYRLKQLSRDITKQTFSDTTERVDAEALKQAQFCSTAICFNMQRMNRMQIIG